MIKRFASGFGKTLSRVKETYHFVHKNFFRRLQRDVLKRIHESIAREGVQALVLYATSHTLKMLAFYGLAVQTFGCA